MALTADQIRDAAYNQVATAAVFYQQGHVGLVRMLACARDHGLTLPELAEASGRSEAFITELLEEAD